MPIGKPHCEGVRLAGIDDAILGTASRVFNAKQSHTRRRFAARAAADRQVQLAIVTPYGLAKAARRAEIVGNVVTLEDLLANWD